MGIQCQILQLLLFTLYTSVVYFKVNVYYTNKDLNMKVFTHAWWHFQYLIAKRNLRLQAKHTELG